MLTPEFDYSGHLSTGINDKRDSCNFEIINFLISAAICQPHSRMKYTYLNSNDSQALYVASATLTKVIVVLEKK